MDDKILELFIDNNRLKFHEIEDSLRERSNKIAYHLGKLIAKRLIIKEGNEYLLADEAEHLIPYMSEKKSVLPVVLIRISDGRRVFLYRRNKKPYLGKYSLPGGRLTLGESIENASRRIMKIKFGIEINSISVDSISLEHVQRGKKIIHSFLLILTSAKTLDNIKFQNCAKIRREIIKSDYKLITSPGNGYKIRTILSRAV